MSSNINSNPFSTNAFTSRNSPFEDKPLKESLRESKLNTVDSSSAKSDSQRDSVSIFNENGNNSVNYDFSNYSHKNSIAEA